MIDTQLIIITGMSGSGKSTTAQYLSKQYEKNNTDYCWLHEEIKNHPIRIGEFNEGKVQTEKDLDLSLQDMYNRWQKLTDEIETSNKVYIMEGCLFQNIIRYFLNCHYPIEKIGNYYDQVLDITKKLNPTIVFLNREDIRASFKEAFKVRGKRWENLILDPEGEGYFSKYPYKGDESIYQMWEHYLKISHEMFERIKGRKIKFMTAEGLWSQYMKQLTEYLGLEYKPEIEVEKDFNVKIYCGKYRAEGGPVTIEIKLVNNNLYCKVFFWENMKMLPIGEHEFEIQSFPIKLAFEFRNGKKILRVLGTYGWSLTGKTLNEVK